MSDYDRGLYMSEQKVNVTVSGYLNGSSYQRRYRRRLLSYYKKFTRNLAISMDSTWPTRQVEREIWKTILGTNRNREQHIASLVGELVRRESFSLAPL